MKNSVWIFVSSSTLLSCVRNVEFNEHGANFDIETDSIKTNSRFSDSTTKFIQKKNDSITNKIEFNDSTTNSI